MNYRRRMCISCFREQKTPTFPICKNKNWHSCFSFSISSYNFCVLSSFRLRRLLFYAYFLDLNNFSFVVIVLVRVLEVARLDVLILPELHRCVNHDQQILNNTRYSKIVFRIRIVLCCLNPAKMLNRKQQICRGKTSHI